MSRSPDRLFDLMPAIYRLRDAEQGGPLQALLRVIGEQVDVVEDDIARLYDNWFIETCEDWVVPYIADLIGYRPVREAGEPGEARSRQGRGRNQALIPRREVANTLRYRSRKGTLALLELLAHDVAGWPARAVEFRQLLGWNQNVRHPRPELGRTLDVRDGLAMQRLNGPFDTAAHTVEVRRLASPQEPGRYGLAAVGLFLWRLRSYSVTGAPAHCLEKAKNRFTFSSLGNDTPLFLRPAPEADPTAIAGELELPIRISRRFLAKNLAACHGAGKSFEIQVGKTDGPGKPVTYETVAAESLLAADLSDWQYVPPKGRVAVDPELGRIAFPLREAPRQGVRVTWHYGAVADVGGGEYDRPLRQSAGAEVLRVGEGGDFPRILDAVAHWQNDKLKKDKPAVVEIMDSGVYTEQLDIHLTVGQNLQIRAARRKRPIVRLINWETSKPDSFFIRGEAGSRIVLDGLLIAGQSVYVEGPLAAVTIRHSTLVPGWDLEPDCGPRQPAEPSLELHDLQGKVTIDHCFLGSIQLLQGEVLTEPVPIHILDSVLDATDEELEALGSPSYPVAHARLTVARSTVFGQIQVHAVELAENSIFEGLLLVARRQTGCVRFCSVLPGSRTPRRFQCQPDLAERVTESIAGPAERLAARDRERQRVRPRFDSRRYGTPEYARLARACAVEIRRGAEDESEMGVYHDLYEPQREANLRARLDEYTPAGLDAGLIFAS